MTYVTVIREHLRALFGFDNGGDPPGWVSTWARHRQHRCTRTLATDSPFGELPDYCAALSCEGWDVYVGVGLQCRNPGRYRRGAATDVLALPALWMDIDIAGANHAQTNLPGNVDAALDFLASLPLEPTVVLHSGFGLQPYWCFAELQVLETDEERALANTFSRAFQQFIIERGRERGWRLDNTADLSRVLRLGGTFNWKSASPVPVQIIRHGSTRYKPAGLLSMCRVEPPKGSGSTESTSVHRRLPKGEGAADIETRIRSCLAVVGPWTPGNRDNCAFQLASFVRNRLPELSATDALDWLRRLNAECRPPLEDSVLVDKVRRLWAA